jgi:hypothetical protein
VRQSAQLFSPTCSALREASPQRTSATAKLGFQAHAHMLRHACGYKLANDRTDGHGCGDGLVRASRLCKGAPQSHRKMILQLAQPDARRSTCMPVR